MQQVTNKLVLGVAVEAVVIALVMATAMTVVACVTSLNPNVDHPNAIQIVLFVLNLPALVVWMGGGENDKLGILFRICVFLQWLVLGGGIGLLVAVIRRAMRRA